MHRLGWVPTTPSRLAGPKAFTTPGVDVGKHGVGRVVSYSRRPTSRSSGRIRSSRSAREPTVKRRGIHETSNSRIRASHRWTGAGGRDVDRRNASASAASRPFHCARGGATAQHRLHRRRRPGLEGRRLSRLRHQDAEHRQARRGRRAARAVLRAADVHADARRPDDRALSVPLRPADRSSSRRATPTACRPTSGCCRRRSRKPATRPRSSASGTSATPTRSTGRASAASTTSTAR